MSSKTVSTLINQTENQKVAGATLPVTIHLRWLYLFSLLIAVLTAVAALAGLLYPNELYTTEEIRQLSPIANDILTLILGLPVLLGSMWLAWRGKLIGLLCWPGAIFYGLYNYLIYLFALPFNVIFPLYMVIVSLSIYTTIGLVASMDGEAVKERLDGRVPARLGGGFLIGFGLLFMLRSFGEMGTALADQTSISRPELALLVTDFIMCGAWVMGGVLLWRKRPLGFVSGTGLLVQASMLFVGVIAVVLLQPILTGDPFQLGDFIILSVMGLICFVPFALFLRGIVKASPIPQ